MLTNATASANNRRMPVGTWSEGVSRESSHMAAATSTAIAGGGILSSSEFIGSIMRPNERLSRAFSVGLKPVVSLRRFTRRYSRREKAHCLLGRCKIIINLMESHMVEVLTFTLKIIWSNATFNCSDNAS